MQIEGPDVDLPGMGDGVMEKETGYLYGQYKRINQHYGQVGKYGNGINQDDYLFQQT